MRPHVALINRSTVVSDEDVNRWRVALQAQVNSDFEPIWGAGCHIEVHDQASVPAGYWWLVVLDNADQAGALGYHDLTSDLLPIGKVFAKTTLNDGAQPSVTASHELLEMLGDPHINLTAEDNGSRLYAYETADAVEADRLGYQVDGVLVSDFVTLEWFDPLAANRSGHKFSFRENVHAPFELAPGGYISYVDLNHLAAGWQQEYAEHDGEGLIGARAPGFPEGSRRARRTRRKQDLRPSEPKS